VYDDSTYKLLKYLAKQKDFITIIQHNRGDLPAKCRAEVVLFYESGIQSRLSQIHSYNQQQFLAGAKGACCTAYKLAHFTWKITEKNENVNQ